MAKMPRPDHDKAVALFAEIGLDPNQVVQWPSVERHPRARWTAELTYEVMSGDTYTLTVSANWARRYTDLWSV